MKLNLVRVDSVMRLAQIEKVVTYAKDFLNVEVKFVKDMENAAGLYTAPRGERRGLVEVYNKYTGLSTLITLLHELGHHIDYLERGYVHDEEIAYHFYPSEKDTKCPIKYRKHIRNVENLANLHAWKIAKYLDLKIPIFAFVKDVLYQKESLNYILANGPTNKKVRDKISKKCHKRAKEILCKSENPILLLWSMK